MRTTTCAWAAAGTRKTASSAARRNFFMEWISFFVSLVRPVWEDEAFCRMKRLVWGIVAVCGENG
jgi:hypothetical protein